MVRGKYRGRDINLVNREVMKDIRDNINSKHMIAAEAIREVMKSREKALLEGDVYFYKKTTTSKVAVDRKNIYLWDPEQAGKYSPLWDDIGYTREDHVYVNQNYDKPGFPWDKYQFKFKWNLKTELEEKKLRSHDCFCEGKGLFMMRGFFIHDWLLECWHDLVDRDIQVIPTECYTKNGTVKKFHLVYVKHVVDGIDKELTDYYSKGENYIKDVPKADNVFMEGHELAAQESTSLYIFIYITPELRARTLAKKKQLKKVWVPTFKEYWDHVNGYRYGPY